MCANVLYGIDGGIVCVVQSIYDLTLNLELIATKVSQLYPIQKNLLYHILKVPQNIMREGVKITQYVPYNVSRN